MIDDQQKYYDPSEKEKETRSKVYKRFKESRDLRNQRYKYFNDRTLKELIDDSELRLSNYVPTRRQQGKEEWQANFSHPVTSNKLNAILASVALDVPETKITARNEKSMKSILRAFIMKNLVKFSFDNDNKEEQVYFEAWEAAAKGTVVVYDGYLKQKAKRKTVTKYDQTTGEVEYDEEDVIVKDECVSFIVPLENIYLANFFIPNIQEQPFIIWAENMDRSRFRQEFSKFPNYEFVKSSPKILNKEFENRYFYEAWSSRVKGTSPIEVVRYYNKYSDEFIVMANGVVLFDGPMLLGKKKKWYPFAKTIFYPFAPDFFYGNPHANKMMGEQDIINSLYNMAVDKTYKSMIPNLLIGNVNKDDLDLEDDVVSLDTKIYVQDINQVKYLDSPGLGNADVKMMDLIGRGLDLTSVDANQQGIAGRGVTAREVVIANENARRLKGVFYLFLTSLWLQKIKLRIQNILTYYTDTNLGRALSPSGNDKDNMFDRYKRFTIEGADLGDGQKGTLEVNIAKSDEELPSSGQLQSRTDSKSKEYKDNFKAIAMTSDFLDNWEFDVKVVSESIFQNESSLSQAKMEDKIKLMATVFPEYLQVNKEKVFKQAIAAYDDDPEEYDTTPPQPQQDPNAPQQTGGQSQPVQQPQKQPQQPGVPQGIPPGQ